MPDFPTYEELSTEETACSPSVGEWRKEDYRSLNNIESLDECKERCTYDKSDKSCKGISHAYAQNVCIKWFKEIISEAQWTDEIKNELAKMGFWGDNDIWASPSDKWNCWVKKTALQG